MKVHSLRNRFPAERFESAAVRAHLLRWFKRNARALPWRRTPSPYRVWVSEVMLQQTQVATVVPYYRRFMRRFPSLRKLATSRVERVYECWSGLGYYRRARDLHRAVKIVARRFGGRFPRQLDLACSLPGVGDYTARAVLSIACSVPLAAVDGNVARVMARLLALRGNLAQSRFRGTISRALEETISLRRPGDFNQALMELGQTTCLPRAPRCSLCPLKQFCAAKRSGNAESYPELRRRRAMEARHLAVAVIRDAAGRVALRRGLDEGLLGELWNFPSAFGRNRHEARQNLRRRLAELGAPAPRLGLPLATLRHHITFRSIRVSVLAADSNGAHLDGVRWFMPGRLEGSAVSQLARHIALLLTPSESRPPRSA